jgi:hypothetical protein
MGHIFHYLISALKLPYDPEEVKVMATISGFLQAFCSWSHCLILSLALPKSIV